MLIITVSACKNIEPQSYSKETPSDLENHKSNTNTDCYSDRNDILTIVEVEGTIIVTGDMYLIATIDSRYQPCHLPIWATDGTLVTFSGITKNILPNERRAGTPISLTLLQKK